MANIILCRKNFNVETFISLIKERNSIWNFKSAEYNNKEKRSQDWREVCEAMVPDYTERNKIERTEIETELQAKWKVLRDGFVRSRRNQRRVSMAGGTAKPYRYHDLMSFLHTMFRYQTIKRRCNFKSTLKSEPVGRAEESKKQDNTDKNASLVDTITKNVIMKINNDNNDEDRQFLLCLLSDMKRIPKEMKLDAKSDIINVIRHYTSKSTSQNETQSPSHMDYINSADPLVTIETICDDASQDSEQKFRVNF